MMTRAIVVVTLLSQTQTLSLSDAWSTTRSSPPASTTTRAVRQSSLSSSSLFAHPKRRFDTRRRAVQVIETEETEAKSAFGTKEYWDDVYAGRGDFPSEEYSWYYGFDVMKRHIQPYLKKQHNILVPGIGNDSILLDLLSAGYQKITAQDYSQHAIERQHDLLSYYYNHGDNMISQVSLEVSDVRHLPTDWENEFDVVLEKGLLDAVYLSGNGQAEQAVTALARTLRKGGVFVSVSGVVPDNLRCQLFDKDNWMWLRDGSDDLQAGCFVFQKKK